MSAHNPEYATKAQYQFYLKKWNFQEFIKSTEEGIRELNKNEEILQKVSGTYVRLQIKMYVLSYLKWHHLGLTFPILFFDEKKANLDRIVKKNMKIIKDKIYILEGYLSRLFNKATPENYISIYFEEKNYKYIRYNDGEFYVRVNNMERVISVRNDDNLKFIIEMFNKEKQLPERNEEYSQAG